MTLQKSVKFLRNKRDIIGLKKENIIIIVRLHVHVYGLLVPVDASRDPSLPKRRKI